MENKKLTQEEVTQIKNIQDRMQAVQTELGQLELAKMDLANRRKNVEDYLQETRATEVDLVKELEEKYGKGTVNLGTEEFVPDQE
jgi:antitoxin component HigA of HigAB toxin-antitoxin module